MSCMFMKQCFILRADETQNPIKQEPNKALQANTELASNLQGTDL